MKLNYTNLLVRVSIPCPNKGKTFLELGHSQYCPACGKVISSLGTEHSRVEKEIPLEQLKSMLRGEANDE